MCQTILLTYREGVDFATDWRYNDNIFCSYDTKGMGLLMFHGVSTCWSLFELNMTIVLFISLHLPDEIMDGWMIEKLNETNETGLTCQLFPGSTVEVWECQCTPA